MPRAAWLSGFCLFVAMATGCLPLPGHCRPCGGDDERPKTPLTMAASRPDTEELQEEKNGNGENKDNDDVPVKDAAATRSSFARLLLPTSDNQVLQNQMPAGNDNDNAKGGNGNGKEAENEEPKHIRDNAMLVEEAFNQEKGVVQHILNWVQLWDRTPGGRTRDFTFAYTMELPLGSQKHQFSFTFAMLSAFDEPNGAAATQQGGVGDTFLNYRYQLLANDEFLWCSPRLSLIIPTGDVRFGTGTGRVGYQFNLPVSRYGERFDFHFNGGGTLVPYVSLPLPNGTASPRHNLRGANLGVSAYWKPRTNLNLFVESLALWNEDIDDTGARGSSTQVFLNPGVRYAAFQSDDVEWVLGVGVPVGLTPDTPDIGIFAYMSVEHTFRKKNKNGGGD